MGIEVIGKLHVVFDTKQVTDRFQKREFVLEMSDNPKYSLRGREWKSPQGDVKYFNSLDVWSIEPLRAGRRDDAPPRDEEPPPPNDEPRPELDDIPF